MRVKAFFAEMFAKQHTAYEEIRRTWARFPVVTSPIGLIKAPTF